MTYAEFAADLPPNRTMHFTSAEEMEEALQQAGVYQPIRQLGEGEFRSALAVQSTELADLFSVLSRRRAPSVFSFHAARADISGPMGWI